MSEIITLLENISHLVSRAEFRQLMVIVPAVLAMTGQVTMLNISRWTGKGGSYSTVRRLYNAQIAWLQVNWALMSSHLENRGGVFLLGGDETVVTKAGKETYGLDRFFSSIYKRSVPGLSFFGISLISVEEQSSTMMLMEQLTKEETTTQKYPKPKKVKKKGTKRDPGGRPKGSKNKNRRDMELPAYLQNIQNSLEKVLDMVGDRLSVPYCVLDGAFGHNNALQMVRRLGLHLVSKLSKNAGVYFPYAGEQKKYGARRKYGDKLDYAQIPDKYLKSRKTKDEIRTDVYQMSMWSKAFPDLLNIIIIVKTNITNQQQAHVVLFSSDLELECDNLILYYRLRFQIEFNFRDAKQYWGLEDFMNVNQVPVYNAANFAMFTGNIASSLVRQRRKENSAFSTNDLKAEFRGRFYACEALKLLPESHDQTFIERIMKSFSFVGAVNL